MRLAGVVVAVVAGGCAITLLPLMTNVATMRAAELPPLIQSTRAPDHICLLNAWQATNINTSGPKTAKSLLSDD